MKSPPCLWSLILLLCLCLCVFLIGCASTTQTMQPLGGKVTINLGTPENPLVCSGLTVVSINCQVGVTAKPVGLDVLNPAASIAAQQNSGTADSNATAGPVTQTKPTALPADHIPDAGKKVADSTTVPEPDKPTVSGTELIEAVDKGGDSSNRAEPAKVPPAVGATADTGGVSAALSGGG